jgi:hypothetical protein
MKGFADRRRDAMVLAVLLTAACTAEPRTDRTDADVVLAATPSTAPARTSAPLDQELDQSRANAIVRAASRVAPAVVSVNVIRRQAIQARTMWDQFFLPPGAEQRSVGFG